MVSLSSFSAAVRPPQRISVWTEAITAHIQSHLSQEPNEGAFDSAPTDAYLHFMTNQVVNSLPCWRWSETLNAGLFAHKRTHQRAHACLKARVQTDKDFSKYQFSHFLFCQTTWRQRQLHLFAGHWFHNQFCCAMPGCCCFFFRAADAAAAAAVASNWSHVWWKNRPRFMEGSHAWSGRELVGYRGHNPNTPTPPGLLTRHADGCISVVSRGSLPSS